MATRPVLVAEHLFLGQFGGIPGAGSWLEFVLFFGKHDVVKPGFLCCANKTNK